MHWRGLLVPHSRRTRTRTHTPIPKRPKHPVRIARQHVVLFQRQPYAPLKLAHRPILLRRQRLKHNRKDQLARKKNTANKLKQGRI